MNNSLKKILVIFLSIIGLQLFRIIFKTLIFLIIKRTLIVDVIVNILFILIILFFIIKFIKKRKIDISFFPKKFNNYYKIFTMLLVLFMIFTILIIKSYTIYSILTFIYNVILTVMYEEIIFRGIVYCEIEKLYNEKYALIISSVLFGIWHLGYIDTIIWRTSMLFNSANIVKILFWKVMTGIVLGFIFAFLRKKSKNVYTSSLIHSLINTIGI